MICALRVSNDSGSAGGGRRQYNLVIQRFYTDHDITEEIH